MKKTISLLLALALALSVTLAAAEEAAVAPAKPVTVNWAELAPEITALGLTGDFYTLDGMAMAFWVPTALQPADIDATYGETNMLAAFQMETGGGFFISFYELDAEEIGDFAGIISQLGADSQIMVINGLSACVFAYEDILHVSFLVEGGYVLSFDFYPASDYVFSAVARIIAASVQPYTAGE